MDRSAVIARVARIVLDRRHRDDNSRLFEVQQTFADEGPVTLHQAELMLLCLTFVKEESGEDEVRRIRDRHAMALSF